MGVLGWAPGSVSLRAPAMGDPGEHGDRAWGVASGQAPGCSCPAPPVLFLGELGQTWAEKSKTTQVNW